MLVSFLSGEFLLHTPCWLYFYVRSFYYTSYTGLICVCVCVYVGWGGGGVVSLTHPCCLIFLIWGVSLTHPMLASFSNLGSFSYTSHAVFIFISRISLKHPVLLHFYLGSFSYTSHTDFVFMWGVSLTHPMLASFLYGEFLLHIPCWF